MAPQSFTNRPVLTLTEAARARIVALRARSANPHAFLRLGVKNGGCAGMAYTLDFVNEIGKFDTRVEDGDLALVIDAKAMLFLLGTTMDYVESELSSGFVFHNPNQTGACGCGESVALTPVAPAAVEAYRLGVM